MANLQFGERLAPMLLMSRFDEHVVIRHRLSKLTPEKTRRSSCVEEVATFWDPKSIEKNVTFIHVISGSGKKKKVRALMT